MVDISKAFSTSSETVSDFFQRPGVGFYIPLYQREYSWDSENIDQLMEDICQGVQSLLSQEEKIRFLGTVILVKESNPDANIHPKDRKALPPRIDKVIDGQQRISTIALLACLLYQRLFKISKNLPNEINKSGLNEAIDTYLLTLLELFSFDLRRGVPKIKPIIIRGSVDGWTFDGDDSNYQSGISSFIAAFIRAKENNSDFPRPPRQPHLVSSNIKRINFWLDKVEKAHESDNRDFLPAWEIIEKMDQVDLWSYERSELVSLVINRSSPMSSKDKKVCSIVQLFAFCHYLLQRCCFTLIEPVSDDWAFDMFQSLNATGTPLTALETFKPLVVNSLTGDFKNSKSEECFAQVDKLFSPLRSASSKNKLTNEYLTLLGTTYNGEQQPSRQFSSQRKWLIEKYEECKSVDEKENFIRIMANLANFWTNVIKYEPSTISAIPLTQNVGEEDRKKAELCVLYLQNAGHKMANTILSRFYSLCLRDEPDADKEFVNACKTIAVFFTFWRSALPNAGLDEVYRQLLKDKMSWKKGNHQIKAEVLKTYFLEELKKKDIGTKDEWKNKAKQYLRYDNAKAVCRFALFVTSHDTISDVSNPGLMKMGTSGSSPYFHPSKWISEDCKSIEHIAPQTPAPDGDWDRALYESNDGYEQIGNLLLLPTEINSSAGNKGWMEKLIYYRHLAETDPDKLAALRQEAKDNGVELKESTISLLKKTSYKHHIEPIVQIGSSGRWDKNLVEKRTDRICDLLWERMSEWLSEVS